MYLALYYPIVHRLLLLTVIVLYVAMRQSNSTYCCQAYNHFAEIFIVHIFVPGPPVLHWLQPWYLVNETSGEGTFLHLQISGLAITLCLSSYLTLFTNLCKIKNNILRLVIKTPAFKFIEAQ